jgi:hypothetical protein
MENPCVFTNLRGHGVAETFEKPPITILVANYLNIWSDLRIALDETAYSGR